MFKNTYVIGMLTMFAIRVYYRWRFRTNKIDESRRGTLEIILLCIAFIGMLVIPLSYVFSSLLSFADYQIPFGLGWIGTAVKVIR